MCVFPTAARHPLLSSRPWGPQGSTGGEGGPTTSSASPMNIPGLSLSAWETEAINRQNAVKSGWG